MKCFVRAGVLSATLLFGCSDDREPIPALPDGGALVDGEVTDDVSADAFTVDRYVDWFDVIPLGDAGCPACIRDRCGSQINACANNPACAAGLLCTLQMCATGLLGSDSGVSPASLVCVLGCFNGDQATAFVAIRSLTCLTMTCGGVCSLGAAGTVDARPISDVQTEPEASVDAIPEDGSDDTTLPEAGTAADATSEMANFIDMGSPMDAASEMAPTEGGSAD